MDVTKVSENLCNERSGNILEKITNIDTKLDKIMNNHLSHLSNDIKVLQKKVFLISDYIDDEEKNKQEKKAWTRFVIPFITGLTFSTLTLIFKLLGII